MARTNTNTRKVVSQTTTKKSVVTTTTKKPVVTTTTKKPASDGDLRPGERRVPSRYKPFSQQNYNRADILPMEPADTATFSKPGYRVDLSRSKKVVSNGVTRGYQETYIKLAPNSGKKTTPVKPPVVKEKVEVGKLAIKKPKTIETGSKSELVKGPKPTLEVPVEVKYKKEPKVKAQSKGGKPLQRLATNAKATAKNIVGPAKFKREEKLAGAYERVGKAVSTKGNSAKQNIKDIKEFKKYVKSEEGQKRYGKETKSLKKDLNQSKRYIKREEKGKNKYFNQEALNKTQEMTQAELKKSKGKKQAGRTRFS